MNRKYNIQLNLSPYANYYAVGGNTGFKEVLEEENPVEFNRQLETQKDNKFLDFMNNSGGGGWAAAIAPAATNAINAITDTEASTAERVATAMGIPALAKIWTADNTVGDANLKAMQSNIDTFAKQNLIQDASSTFGANNAVKLNNKFIAPVPMTGVKDLSWKDFRGNMFKKGAAATLQGAAAGSVGGPWGALGGAIVGLGSSLFGGIGARSRAKKAYAEYQNKMATLTSQANSMYKQALTNQTLSNMQALANGNMSQRINDMANIRAFGGNLFDGGGSVIDPDPPSYFMSDAEKEREMAERARIANETEENPITADMLAAAHQDAYYPDRLADTYPEWLPLIGGDRVGELSENSAWWERILPYAGTAIDWDAALADPNWKNIASAGVSTALDFLPILRALKGLYTGAKTAFVTSRGIGKGINLSRESKTAKHAAMDSYENAEKNLLLDQLNKRFDIGTSSAQKAVDRYYDVVNATKQGTSRLGGIARGTATAAKNAGKTYLRNLATTDLLGGIATEELQSGADLAAEKGDFSYMDIRDLIPGIDYTHNTILSNNGVHFTYNPSSRTWVSEESQDGKRIVVPAEEMEQNLQKGLGKIIKDTEYALGGNLFDGGGNLTDEQQMVLADIQADPRILFTPKYSQWRDYIRRTSPDYLDRLYTSLPYEQQKDIYQNDREAWGALSNNVKGNFGSSKVRNESNEISPYVAGGLAATLAAPAAIEALGAYALPYTYNGAVSGLNAASDYVMGTRFGQAVAPYVSNLLKPAADATFAFEGAKNFASSEGFNKTWNHFANGEIANGITSGFGDALDLLMVGQGKPLLDATKEAATAIKKGGKYIKKQMTASSRAEKLLDELDERMIHTDRQLSALNDDRLKADRLKYKAKQFFPSPSADIPIPSYVDYQDKFYKRIKNLLENNKIDEAETLLNNVNSPYKITRLPNGEYGLPLYSETPYSDGFLLGEKEMYNPLTGQYDSYYLDPSGLPSNINYLTGAGKKSVKMDGRGIPEDYRNTISKNIDYITNELYPGTSPFGSSVLASEGNLYTNPHDFEVYMPESMLGKYKTNEWSQISPDTYTFTHPKVGDIDFNILRETPEGFATGQRSWQLASRQHPDWYKQYADKRFEDIAKGVNRNPIEQDPLPWTPQELLENANPNVNTMTDALFANKNAKHRNRRLYYLNNAKIDDLKASINEYGNYVMGGNYKPSDVPLSAFSDPSTNSKILDKMGINGIDKSVTNDPERMKTLFEYSILHKQIYGRGITESNVASRGWDAVGSWLPETTGGTVHGVGLNTVRGGNSGHGNVYSILQPKSIEGITDPFDAIKVLDESVGIKELSNSERQQIRDAINNLGIDIYLPKEFSLKDVLRGTSGKKGVKYQQLNKAIEKITNTSGITDESEYGTGIYTSLWDLPQSKSANIIFGDLDRPNNPELLNTRNNTNPLFGEFLDRRVKNKVEKAINDSKMNSGRIYDSQSTVDRMYDVSNERYNKIDSYRDLINDRRRNVATKLAKAQSNAETIKQVSLPVGIGGAVFGGIAALSNYTGHRHQIIEDAQKAGIDIRMKRGEETSDEYLDRLERELIQMGFYGQEALEEYNQYNNTEYAMGGNLYPIGGTIREGYEEVAQEPVYEGGELPEITVSAESMPWYEKAWRKFDRNVLKYPKYAYNYFFPDKNKFIELNDDIEINRITDTNSPYDYILSNEFVEKQYPNTVRTAKDFQYPNQDTLLGDKQIPLSNFSTYYGIENGKLKAGKASDFEDNTYIVPNRTKNVGKVKKIQLPIEGEYDWGMPWSDERAEKDALEEEYRTLKVNFGNQEKYKDELRKEFDRIYGQNKVSSKTAGILALNRLISKHQDEFDEYTKDWSDRKRALTKKVTIKEPQEGYVINENNDTLPLPNLNAKPKMYFADEDGNAIFVSGLDKNIDNVNNFLSQHPSYPIMVDNGRFKHISKDGDANTYTGGFMDANSPNNYIIGINTKAMGGNLYTDLSPNMINLWSNKQQIDQQKAMNQQFSLGLGNTAFANQFAGGGQMTSADVPDNMQYYANGGTHEENPYGGIQVGTDQQGTPNFAEEGEFRWNDFVFSDRINVDANLLSSFNLAPATKHQNKKAAKGKLSYADMAKKYAKRNKELENDPITKNSMEAFMQRLANAQEYQKKAEQLEAQKQNELQDYKTALNKQNNNPMYGTMKYNGMGNAATQQGVNSGVDAGMGNPMSNADLSNVNRSGNEMMAAYGGNLFLVGGNTDNPYKTLPVDLYGRPTVQYISDLPQANIQNPIVNKTDNQYLTELTDPWARQRLLINTGYMKPEHYTGYWGNISKAAWDNFNLDRQAREKENYNTSVNNFRQQTGWTDNNLNLGVRNGNAITDANNLGDGQTSYNNAAANTNIGRSSLTGNISGVSTNVPQKTTPNTNPDAAVPSDPKEVPLYSTAGKYAQFGKGIMPMVWDWANRTNVAYDPYQRDADRLEALANEGPALRTADTIGGYRAPDLMDVERLNNSSRSEGLAQMQAILDAANGNRGYVGAHSAQNNYNTQMGIGSNYVKTQEANNANRLQTDQFNHGINVANQNAINAMYQDNQRAEQTQHQAALSGTAQAAALRQRENLHADEVNTERMKNRATNQAAAVDNALNYFTTQAMENQELNTRNNDPTNPYWIDKYGRTHYTGDSGLTQAIRDAFGNDEYGRNGTFTGDRLTEWNNLTKKYKAKDLKEHPELWRHLVAQQREANKIDAEKAEQARTEELEALRGTYQSNLARLNALRDSGAIISDPSYNLYTGWADDDYSGNQGLLRTRNQALDQYITQIGNNYDRYLYEKQLAQNQAKALGGYINAGQNNNNDYYSYTRI